MTRSLLFGYTVEQDDGIVVVTLTGSMAAQFLERLAGPGRGRGAGGGLLPFPLAGLGSASIRLGGPANGANGAACQPERPDLKAIFGQGFDRDYQSFEADLADYRALLEGDVGGEAEADPDAAEAAFAEPAAAAPAPAAKAARRRPAKTRKGAGKAR
jgi:hypothetical protein